MPTYSYACDKCNQDFELFFYIKDYVECPVCTSCGSKKTHRRYIDDVSTLNASVKKSDSELKTLGDLANRNRDRMSEDQKQSLHEKHNAYRDDQVLQDLPKGMTRMKKQPKTKWT
jgi:putative FmdB family regulatory protein